MLGAACDEPKEKPRGAFDLPCDPRGSNLRMKRRPTPRFEVKMVMRGSTVVHERIAHSIIAMALRLCDVLGDLCVSINSLKRPGSMSRRPFWHRRLNPPLCLRDSVVHSCDVFVPASCLRAFVVATGSFLNRSRAPPPPRTRHLRCLLGYSRRRRGRGSCRPRGGRRVGRAVRPLADAPLP